MARIRKSNESKQLGNATFPIVGIVASAGGLDAFKQFFNTVPIDCAMAFVLVPHLDPKHESQMVALLSKISLLPVATANQGMVVEANHVYVIPANRFLTIEDGVLQLSEHPAPQGRETAIDFFLRSLARDQGERSVGIVLSGTGSHGTLGIRDIKVAGGMAIAQQPDTAEFDTMPSSIIHEGLADYVLAPADMPATLMQYMRQPYLNLTQPFSSDASSTEGDQVTAVISLLMKHTEYDFSNYRKNMILRRIQRRMGLHHLENMQQYVQRLKDDSVESTALYRDLLISVTAFFRDPDAYQALQAQLKLEVSARDASRYPYRIWVPGCATGEEAYSLAMLMIECLNDRSAVAGQQADPTKMIQVFASDVDESAIAVARAGIYPSTIASDVSQTRLDKFFTQVDVAHFQIGKQLREAIVFSKQNLINDSPFSKVDLVSCRNLLIYLEPEMQRKVISLFHFALCDHGVLMLGPSESISQSDQLFTPISKKWRIFRKVNAKRRNRLPLPLAANRGLNGLNQMQQVSQPQRQGHKEIVEKALISFYAPATVLINQSYEILYMTGPLVDYLEFPAGEPNHNLLSMCRPGLRTKLRIACQKAIAEEVDNEVVTQMKRGSGTIQCTINVRRLNTRLEVESPLLVSFSDSPRPETVASSVSVDAAAASPSDYSDQLERELKWNSDELRGVIEDLEGANEELKTSNEEIMSMNEELQSSNEELETSKEELQSLNEELSTVNVELLEKVTDLDIANNDILNLLASTDIATLFLDDALQIQRFTPPTVQLLNVRSTDIGRPLSDITTRFVDDFFLHDCREVIRESKAIQSTVEGENFRMYLRRILPYRSHGDQVVGVVITFVDLTDRLLLEKSLKESKDHLEAILDSAVDAILTIDEQGIISKLNSATERLFGLSRAEILGNSVTGLLTQGGGEQPIQFPSIPSMPTSKFGTESYLELKAKRKGSEDFDAELTVSRIASSSLFIVVIRDVSQRMDLQKKILEIASDEQRRIGQELHDGTQQELTGLSLIAGTIDDFFSQREKADASDFERLTLDEGELSRLAMTASKLVQGLNEANRHVQSLSHGIMPVQIDIKGLHSALTELAHETSVENKVDCNFVQSGALTIESNAVATHLYRIAQEAINNAQRHGGAKNISVSLSGDNQKVILEISDDGCGMDASLMTVNGKPNHGTGLQIMEYRASVIGGKLSIFAGESQGATVRCTIPK